MNPTLFFENFELLADSPNGVQKLRELILQLAVMGKLVSQDPNDEPAMVLVEKIETEKRRLIKEKLIRSESFAPINEDELFFKIPANWEWTRLGQIGDWGAGSTPNRKNPDYYGGIIKWFKSGELNDGYIIESEEKITDLALKECSLRLNKKEDVLIAMYGATIGKVAILDTEATTNQAVCACTCFTGVYNKYLFFLLKAYLQYFTNQGAGGAQPNISRIKIVNTVVPLPPLAEQKRIVSKVDELMTLCDKLEARRQKKQEIQSNLNNAALEKMLSAENQEEFEQNWQRICENFDLLYDNPENVEKLKQAILQLAVQGKLVEQNPEDEPAALLLEKMKFEKKRIVKGSKTKELTSISSTDADQNPYEIPSSWEWITLSQCGMINPRNYVSDEKEISFVPMTYISEKYGQNVETETRKWEEVKKSFTHFAENDVVLAKITPCFQNRKSAVMRGLKNGFGAGTTELHVFRPLTELICPEYVLIYLKSPDFIYGGIPRMTGSAGQKRVPKYYFCENPFPLPPLNEQKRIVEKIEQLMGLCDELELKLRKEREDSGKLMETVVKGLLEGAAAQK